MKSSETIPFSMRRIVNPTPYGEDPRERALRVANIINSGQILKTLETNPDAQSEPTEEGASFLTRVIETAAKILPQNKVGAVLTTAALFVSACAGNTGGETTTTPPPTNKTTTTLPQTTTQLESQNLDTAPENSTGEWDVLGPRLDLPRTVPEGTSHDLKPRDIPQITEAFEDQMLDIYIDGDRNTGTKVETGFLKIKDYSNYQVAQISGYLVGYHETRVNNFFDFGANPPVMSYIILAGRNSDGSTWIKGFLLGRPDVDKLSVWNHYKTEELIENPDRLREEAFSVNDIPISKIGSILEDKSFWLTPQVVIEIPISVEPGASNSDLFEAGARNEIGPNNQILDDLQNHGGLESNVIGWATGIHTFP